MERVKLPRWKMMMRSLINGALYRHSTASLFAFLLFPFLQFVKQFTKIFCCCYSVCCQVYDFRSIIELIWLIRSYAKVGKLNSICLQMRKIWMWRFPRSLLKRRSICSHIYYFLSQSWCCCSYSKTHWLPSRVGKIVEIYTLCMFLLADWPVCSDRYQRCDVGSQLL